MADKTQNQNAVKKGKVRRIKKGVDGSVLNAILYIVVGVLFIIFRGQTLNWLLTITGVMFIALGIFDVFCGDIPSGIICLAIGLIIILGGWLFVEIALIVFGVLFIVKGVVELRAFLKPFSLLGVIFSCLTIALGVLLVVSKWVVLDWYFILIGVFYVVSGVVGIFDGGFIKKVR